MSCNASNFSMKRCLAIQPGAKPTSVFSRNQPEIHRTNINDSKLLMLICLTFWLRGSMIGPLHFRIIKSFSYHKKSLMPTLYNVELYSVVSHFNFSNKPKNCKSPLFKIFHSIFIFEIFVDEFHDHASQLSRYQGLPFGEPMAIATQSIESHCSDFLISFY